MSKHRIQIIAALSALAFAAGTAPAFAKGDKSSATQASAQQHPSVAGTSDAQDSKIQLATTVIENQAVSELKGKKVTGSDKSELGQIEDFIIDPQSGKVTHAVVSTGGVMGIGGDLRLLKRDAVKASTTGEEFTAQVDKTAFEAMPVVQRDQLEGKGIAAAVKRAEQKASGSESQTAQSETRDTSENSSAMASSSSSSSSPEQQDQQAQQDQQSGPSLVLASELKGKKLHANGQEAGEIDDVALNVQQGTAAALVTTEEEFAGTDAKFKVPFENLQIRSTENDTIATTLSRDDFAHVQSTSSGGGSQGSSQSNIASTQPSLQSSDTWSQEAQSSVASTDNSQATTRTDASASDTSANASNDTQQASASDPSTSVATSDTPSSADDTSSTVASSMSVAGNDEALTPTGRGDTDTNATIRAAESAIRSAFANDAELESEQIEVKTSGNKITLTGEVDREETKERIESIAKVAADGAEIDNQVKVSNSQ